MTDALQVTPKSIDEVDAIVKATARPSPKLLTLYVLQVLLVLPAAPFMFLPMYFRYSTLRYRFDDDGVHASWGILFRREVSLTYARIQDIHLRRNLFERWLGLGTVQVQTASGGGGAELVIEGVTAFVEVRDFLYARMRGATTKPSTTSTRATGAGVDAEAIALLRDIRAELKATRDAVEQQASGDRDA